MNNLELLNAVTAYIWEEADLLDHREYQDWLKLWTDAGQYVIPIDPDTTDYDNTLNYANDNATMRRMRVERLGSGESVSTTPPSRTVRNVSRVRILNAADGKVEARAAQFLVEYHNGTLRQYAADVTYELVTSEDGFKLDRKVVRLVNSTDALAGIAYIL